MRLLVPLLLAALAPCAFPQSRAEALRKMELAMGPMPRLDRARNLHVQTLSTVDAGSYTQTKLTFEPEPGRKVFAWLLTPKTGGRRPAALCLHQTTRIGKDEPVGVGPKVNLHYAKELAERGWVALVPDYPSFGDDATDFDKEVYGRGYQSATMYGIVNHTRAVDLLAGHPRVNSKQIAVIGHSLGGHNALFAAAFDTRIRAAVTSCGFTSFAKYYGGNLKGWTSNRYMPRIAAVYHNSPQEVPFDFTDVLAAIAPRAVFVNAPVRDSNFEVSGVDDVANAVRSRFPAGRLIIEHPEAEHDFPTPIRQKAYEFLEKSVR
ncbi:MAG TPA: alpha/beta fold hydrolase [Bryobacteraceae bacterium]|nr:alpha/beta fold hydrolase [Bryobacteraceae bacterium]